MLNYTVDWVKLRENMLFAFQRLDLYSPIYWDNEVNTIDENLAHWNQLTKKQLGQLSLTSKTTVLDIGAGTGRITLPVAKQVKHVTALEPSKKLLTILKEKAKQQQISNICYVNQSLDQLNVTGLYDIVIASFSLFMLDIKNALLKINSLASHQVFLFLSASPWVDIELQQKLYGTVALWSDFIFIYNILYDAGILANVKFSDYELRHSFDDIDAAMYKCSQMYHVPFEKQNILRVYLQENLVEDDGKLWFNRKRKLATIWWSTNK
ncbi:MAG: class I SAM-dependent methyltransferase [Nitrososphaerota archaeon]|jgi:2-polyprenyl-3-methyl-5-hydroxy-6-metoxy-1,4-benzoquinol methylase|nr:class I SAM-dependent methyltransferase [Nitrososphaerota archaeon]